MESLVIEYSPTNKAAKEFVAFLKKSGLFKVKKLKNTELSNETFLKKIKKSDAQANEGKVTKIKPSDVWTSL